MGVTIKEIAERAGVSIATVSHVINKTRYVSPALSERVTRVIAETGYVSQKTAKSNNLRVGKLSEVAYIISRMESAIYSGLGTHITNLLKEEGYTVCTYVSDDDLQTEKHILTNVLTNRRIAGIVIVPATSNAKRYKKLIQAGVPFVCIERMIESDLVDCVLADSISAIYKGTSHLIKNGHERIGIVAGTKNRSYTERRLEGYRMAFRDYGLPLDEKLIFTIKPQKGITKDLFAKIREKDFPTGFIVAGNAHTLELLKLIHDMGYEYPGDLSIIGYGDGAWCDVTTSPLTTCRQNIEKMAETAVQILIEKMNGNSPEHKMIRVPVDLIVRESTRCIERGPSGEIATVPEKIIPTDAEIERLRSKGYKIGISFHYSGTEWIRLHERAIRNTMYKFGIDIASVVEAHFDPELQIAQLDGLMMQNLDAIISLPADDSVTISKYKEIADRTKLIFLGVLPDGFDSDSYSAVVSVNEKENGQNAGKILGNYFRGKRDVKVGMITYGAPFFATKQRDGAVEQILVENYNNIEIIAHEYFYHYGDAYEVCKTMMRQYPEIEGLYVSWERPALGVIKALEQLDRTDVSLVTVDLDYRIASYLAKNEIVRGISAQRPYEQGEAAAIATANALLGKKNGKLIGVRPQIVLAQNLSRVWAEIMHSNAPNFIK
ncbi:MAG: LacI family DNA-binding transcriptional regulator [Clostridiales Family XIII bacterium]|jgi:ribose transport system substrate-binding protein|nr:LacI family DNA-binding transcriptional regulator [Clostridiales Family XIII bacterium]